MEEEQYSWSWPRFFVAVGIIPAGFLISFVALGVGLGAGSSGDTIYNWLVVPISELFLFTGPLATLVSGIWVGSMVIRRFWLRR